MGTIGFRPCISLALVLVLFGVTLAASGQEPVKGPDSGPPEDGPPACKVCVAVVGTKKVMKNEYQCKPVDYCLPRLPGLWQLWYAGKTDCLECGRPLYRRVLMKRIVTQECPTVQCEVQIKPAACTPTACGQAK